MVIAPRRHTAAFYDLDVAEQRHIWEILRLLKMRIALSAQVERFDVGFVDGEPDSPVAHTYVHLIPRVAGDGIELPAGAQWVDLDS